MMNAENVKGIIDALKPVADKIGQGAQFLYGVYYRQAIADGFVEVAVSLLAICIVVVISWKLGKILKGAKFEDDTYATFFESGKTREYMAKGAHLVITGFVIFLISLATVDGVRHFINPHYYAIQKIMCQVRDCNAK